ncbi:NAD(P)H-dependent FMN reductase [Paracoccus halophilus]|uniref:NAD(P)H-dependent FMN reductase n=1 Tax=Paracoccus halophilus TaxID=376733 RepID=A0A099F7C9_9RHOB|nr:NADPH-dependent FMN reductase [Paracoccus halophilus]KGJ06176.1 NADPH-dependent FMN reductase [Paracoccus halophilus]SFA45927.1 NAD(P)H-dependent FMN reductase [Paracoccus halophilus]
MVKSVAVMVGSLRRDSINRRLARALEKLADGRLQFHELHIGELPHYNDDLWDNLPESVARFKDRMDHSDAVLAVTPEYNRGYPGLIKNALDWGTRPYGQNSWANKPAAITGTSSGVIGTAVGQSHLKSDMLNMGMIVMTRPEAYIQFKPEAYAADGSVTDDSIRKFLTEFMDSFVTWIDKHG